MAPSSRVNFVRQQGFRSDTKAGCELRYPGLMFQPRLVGLVVAAGVLLQASWLFAGLGALLLWSALLPRWNPFEMLYNWLLAGRDGRQRLTPAPGPRRFAQGLAGVLSVAAAAALGAGSTALAWGIEAFLLLAVAALVFGRFCLGSFLYLHLRGEGAFARRTAPWRSGRG